MLNILRVGPFRRFVDPDMGHILNYSQVMFGAAGVKRESWDKITFVFSQPGAWVGVGLVPIII